MRHHGIGNLHEAGDIGTLHVVDIAGLFAVFHALAVDVGHDLVQTLVNLFAAPGETHRVLSHLKTRGSHTAGIHSLAWGEELFGGDELIHGFSSTAHVRHLCHTERLVGENSISVSSVQLVLGGTRQVDICFLLPWLFAFEEGGSVELLFVWLTDVIA